MYFDFEGGNSPMQLSPPNKDIDLEAGQINPCSLTSVEALWDIAIKCGTKVKLLLVPFFVFFIQTAVS